MVLNALSVVPSPPASFDLEEARVALGAYRENQIQPRAAWINGSFVLGSGSGLQPIP